jgi:hypothetical protein
MMPTPLGVASTLRALSVLFDEKVTGAFMSVL